MADHLTEFCQERYDYEATRRSELTGAVALPVGVLSVLGGALVAVLKGLRPPLDASDWVLAIASGISLLAGLLSAHYLARSYFGYTYRYVATPKQVRDHHAAVKATYIAAAVDAVSSTQYANKKVLEYIQERYAEAAHHNTLNNDRKSYFLHMANGAMIVALIPAVAAGGAYLYSTFHSLPSATRVEIVNASAFQPKEIRHGNGTAERPTSPAPASPGPGVTVSPTGPVHQGAQGAGKATIK